MRYSFRLAEILDHVPDPRKRPGTIKAIVEYTGLDRHQVAALLKNEVKYIPLKALSRLCDYLIEHGYGAADELPGALFAVEPENFWELLARRRRLELCVGIRKTDPTEGPENACVIASDAVLLGELLNGVSTLGGTAKHSRRGMPAGMLPVAPSPAPHPETLKQTLVWSPGQCPDVEMVARAKEVYDDFYESPGDRALICLGSVKSNPVVELIFSNLLAAKPSFPKKSTRRKSELARSTSAFAKMIRRSILSLAARSCHAPSRKRSRESITKNQMAPGTAFPGSRANPTRRSSSMFIANPRAASRWRSAVSPAAQRASSLARLLTAPKNSGRQHTRATASKSAHSSRNSSPPAPPTPGAICC